MVLVAPKVLFPRGIMYYAVLRQMAIGFFILLAQILDGGFNSPVIAMAQPMKSGVEEFRFILKVEKPEYSYDDLLKYAKQLRDASSDNNAKRVFEKYIATMQSMAAKEKQWENEKDQIRKLVFSLRHQTNFESFTVSDANSPAAKLIAIGKGAVPYLIDQLENDALTRSVYGDSFIENNFAPQLRVQRIGDCAAGILRKITGKRFGDSLNIHDPGAKMTPKEVKRLYKEWWDKQPK
jgi:hypothetical protein